MNGNLYLPRAFVNKTAVAFARRTSRLRPNFTSNSNSTSTAAVAAAVVIVAFFLSFLPPPTRPRTHGVWFGWRPSRSLPTNYRQAQPISTAPPAGLRLQMCGLADTPMAAPVTPVMVYAYPHGYMMAYPTNAKAPNNENTQAQARRQSMPSAQVRGAGCGVVWCDVVWSGVCACDSFFLYFGLIWFDLVTAIRVLPVRV